MKLKILVLLIILIPVFSQLNNPVTGELEKPLLKINYTAHSPILIDGDLELNQTVQNEGWSGSGSESDPYIIDDLFVSETVTVDASYEVSITLKNVDQHVIIKNCLLRSLSKHVGMGIFLLGCSNITLMNNNIELYTLATYIINSDDINFLGNTFFDNVAGSNVAGSSYVFYENNAFLNSSQYSFYILNTATVIFHSNYIKFSSIETFSNSPSRFEYITYLSFFNNTFEDIYSIGVIIGETSGAEIASNSFNNCESTDLYLWGLTSSNITRNEFIRTDGTTFEGNLYLTTSNTNIIYENNFYSISSNSEHIFTDTTGNLFSNNGRGNYYSKYTGVDNNADGIGDTPYVIATDVSDLYPLINSVDLLKPFLTSYDNELSYEKSEDVVISWTATDNNPTSYKVYENGLLIKTDSWSNGSNEANLGNLSVGTYFFSIKLLDIDRNFVYFNVTVVVQDTVSTSSLSNNTNPLGDLGSLISDNIIPIAVVSGVGIVSILAIRRVFGGKKKPKGKKPRKKRSKQLPDSQGMRMIHKNKGHSNRYFKKRSYTFSSFFTDLVKILRKRYQHKGLNQTNKLSRKFSEHIMLVVTSVNGCVYCEWGHVNWAKQEGSTDEEITGLLTLNFGELPSQEIIALSFAQHYAETLGNPSSEAIKRLITEYGLEKGQSIISSCEMITIGNLLGNTISAFLSRMQGIPPQKGSFVFEFFVYVFGGFWMDRMMRKSDFSPFN